MPTDLIDVYTLLCDIHAVEDDLSARRLFQQIHAAQKRRFSGTGGSDDHDFFSGCDVLIDVDQHIMVAKALV